MITAYIGDLNERLIVRIVSVRIENFRAFLDQTISFDDYTCLVGPNGAGKSTILTALNIFFREVANASTDLLNLTEENIRFMDEFLSILEQFLKKRV